MILGLSGYARSGKDEAAKVLVEEFGYKRVAFADKLRDVLYALNPMVSYGEWQFVEHAGRWFTIDSGMHKTIGVQDVIDQYGWDGYKETPYGTEIRRLLQRLGTEAGREQLGQDIWVDAAFQGLSDSDKIVVTDVRFPNEAQAIKDRGGWVVRVKRVSVKEANSHPSETSLDDWDFDVHLSNWGTLDEYRQHVRDFHDWMGTELYYQHVIGDQ